MGFFLCRIWVFTIALLAVHFIDDFHVLSNLALDTLVCFALHLTVLLKLFASLFDVLDSAPNDLKLLVLVDPLLNKRLFIDSMCLCIAASLRSCFIKPVVKGQLLLVDDLLTIADHFILITVLLQLEISILRS